MKDCGAAVRTIKTAWATSEGWSILLRSFSRDDFCDALDDAGVGVPDGGWPKSVATEPGQMAETRMP